MVQTRRLVGFLLAVASPWPSVSGLTIPSGAWCEAEIDYSAANEFFRAHYDDEASYFQSDRTRELIHDARQGLWGDGRLPSLENCGFELLYAPTAVTDFEDLDQIRSVYLPELRNDVIPWVVHGVSDIVFWHPMYRGEDRIIDGNIRDNRLPTASVAPLVHIDTDVGAYKDAAELVDLIDKNRFDDDAQRESFSKDRMVEAINAGHRFGILNVWRNAGIQPVQSAPLGLLDTKYLPQKPQNRCCFPERPSAQSRWYAFSEMMSEECLLFKQYDRNVLMPSDVWHCALSSIRESGAPPRQSFDLRAFLLFDETVPPELDRFGSDRMRPLLSREESGCFCESQAHARQASS